MKKGYKWSNGTNFQAILIGANSPFTRRTSLLVTSDVEVTEWGGGGGGFSVIVTNGA
jgi:hypothetical protein